jgi:hypothetical protein
MPDEPHAEFLRLFIALPVPAEVRAEIARAQVQLKCCLPPGVVRWVRAEQFHLTLKFLGDIHPTQLDALKKSVAEACAGLLPPALSAKGVGFFPHAQKPRVIWAGVEGEAKNCPTSDRATPVGSVSGGASSLSRQSVLRRRIPASRFHFPPDRLDTI